MTKSLSRKEALLELIFAGALWGFGFVATQWALFSFSPALLLVLRFLLGGVVGLVLMLIFPRLSSAKFQWKPELKDSIGAGLLLAIFMMLQTIGMQYTTATKSGFLTILYVLLVPIFSRFLLKQKAHPSLYFFVALSFLGALLLMGISLHQFSDMLMQINQGDLWTLSCSVISALHIIYISKVSPRISSAFRFNTLQSLWAFLFMVPFLFLQNSLQITQINLNAVVGILILGIGSSCIAFALQVRAQKVLDSTTASMLFLLESPFAYLFAAIFLKESLNLQQNIGAGTIMLSAILTILLEHWKDSKQKKQQ